jgi:DNA-binding XRE family transcriptional regulator
MELILDVPSFVFGMVVGIFRMSFRPPSFKKHYRTPLILADQLRDLIEDEMRVGQKFTRVDIAKRLDCQGIENERMSIAFQHLRMKGEIKSKGRIWTVTKPRMIWSTVYWFVGSRLMVERRSKGLTRNQLAKEIGISSGQVIRSWEEKAIIPNFRSIEVLSDFFGVKFDYFYDYEERLRPISN